MNSTVATSAMPIGMPGWPEFGLLHGVHGEGPDGVRQVAVGGGLFGHFDADAAWRFLGTARTMTAGLWRVNAQNVAEIAPECSTGTKC